LMFHIRLASQAALDDKFHKEGSWSWYES
jgi:hypothetical protein